MTKQELGRRLVSARARMGLMQKELAEKSGVSAVTISGIESHRGSPTLQTIDKLSIALGEDLLQPAAVVLHPESVLWEISDAADLAEAERNAVFLLLRYLRKRDAKQENS